MGMERPGMISRSMEHINRDCKNEWWMNNRSRSLPRHLEHTVERNIEKIVEVPDIEFENRKHSEIRSYIRVNLVTVMENFKFLQCQILLPRYY